MTLKLKKRFNQNKVKVVSTVIVSGIIMVFVLTLMGVVMQNALDAAEEDYRESCTHVLNGYANAVEYYLDTYKTSLSSIYDRELFLSGDTKKIQGWLMQNVPYIHKDFCATFYVTAHDKKGYFSQGSILDLSEAKYLKNVKFENDGYYMSDIVFSKQSDYPLFIIEQPVYDANNKLSGTLCAAIRLSALEKIKKTIHIGDTNAIYIMDRTGKFVVHQQKNYIGKIFIPTAEKYKHVTSDVTAKSGTSIAETENENGQPVNLYSTQIHDCGWTISVAFPKTEIQALQEEQKSTKIIIFVIASIALTLLLILETLISDYFYKNQLIDAVYDPLTTLWTRQHFESEAEKIIRHENDCIFMLVESDIRGFKFVNQNYGEDIADKVILYFSKLVSKVVKEHNGIIGRGYADHFYALMKVQKIPCAMKEAHKELEMLKKKCGEFEIPFSPKFGISFLRQENKHGTTIKELIGQTSFAKSTLGENMMSNHAIYNSELLEKVNEERFIETSMEKALENEEFFVMYQPKIQLATEKIVGAEALIRWKTNDMGLLPPSKFIPIFERNGFITELDFFVYEKVFQFLRRQIDKDEPVVPISVNMSRNHNQPERFMRKFMKLFRKYNIPSELIQVEILERSVMDNNTLCEITERLHAEGFSVAMDDFGSGESSLNMLTKVPVDVLKFDKDFLLSSTNKNGTMDEKSAKFIRSLIDLSKNMDKQTIFEGVETRAQRDFLRSADCDQVQGFFYSQPLVEADFINFILKNRKM
ncbi:MAG: GGDEF domain-containing protein [Treponema sp.]|nr:GGDEF domain-containing protein [Treponema sp.]